MERGVRDGWRILSLALVTVAAFVGAAALPASAAAPATTSGSAAYTYDAPVLFSSLDTVASYERASCPGSELVSRESSVVVLGRAVAANTVDQVAAAASKVGPTTAHGAERIAGAGATRGGVLAEDEILLVRGYGQVLTQADGASVRVLQNEAGRFNVVIDGDRGLITTFNNLSQKSLERLATRYGWE